VSAAVAVVVGNPRPRSRTSAVAAEVARQVAAAVGGDVSLIVELAEHGPAVLDPTAPEVVAASTAVASADIVVVASPTYKATYTGLLKAFLDRYGADALAGVVAVGVMVGAAPHHAPGGERYLRPLLEELGAHVPAPTLYVMEYQLEALSDVVAVWAAGATPALRDAVGARG
jgi:FMN reductase